MSKANSATDATASKVEGILLAIKSYLSILHALRGSE